MRWERRKAGWQGSRQPLMFIWKGFAQTDLWKLSFCTNRLASNTNRSLKTEFWTNSSRSLMLIWKGFAHKKKKFSIGKHKYFHRERFAERRLTNPFMFNEPLFIWKSFAQIGAQFNVNRYCAHIFAHLHRSADTDREKSFTAWICLVACWPCETILFLGAACSTQMAGRR